MRGEEWLPYIASLAVVLGTVISSVRSGSAGAQAALVASLKERIDTLEAHITDLEATINELRRELRATRKRG